MRDSRRILVDARTRMNYAMFAPVHAAMRGDPRLRFAFISSDDPSRSRAVFAGAGADATLVGRLRAAVVKYDAYITSDFTWTKHVFHPVRIQMFHGVGGKYGFDAPTESLRSWHRLFFVNRRRLENCVKAGAIDADDPAIRLIGMPKVDCLVDGSLDRASVLEGLGLDPSLPTVLYAPTWSPASSLNRLGIELIRALASRPLNLIVKLHDRSCDLRPQYSGGVDWPKQLRPLLDRPRTRLAETANIAPCLVAASLMITDHSSAGFEFLLLDRPLVRIEVPELLQQAHIHEDYVRLLAGAAYNVTDVSSTVAAVDRALADPAAHSLTRRQVATDLFYRPGTATARCALELYDLLQLPAPATLVAATRETTPCLQSA